MKKFDYNPTEQLSLPFAAPISADTEYNAQQREQIDLGLEDGVDVSVYADPEFEWEQMDSIRHGLKRGLNVSIYTDPKYSSAQMWEIYLGLKKDLNVSMYTDPAFTWKQMFMVRWGLEAGVNVSAYADPKNSCETMNNILKSLKKELYMSTSLLPNEITQSVQRTRLLWENLQENELLTTVLENQYPKDSPVFQDKEFMLQVLGETNDRALDLYVLLPENLQHDDEIIRTAIHYSQKNTSESFLDVAPNDLKRNLYYIEETLNSSRSAKSNKETLMNIFSIEDERAGEMLKYASEDLRDDPEVVAAAVLRNSQAIKFSSERIQENPDLLKPYQKEAAHVRPAVQLNKRTGKGLER